ncbi:MAG: DNA topoisomerase VI subunit B [Candidatus Thorarchaeota archaeon]|nr:DNA topoisomerase VI subunit B [Candidatus Thorarchaeota archaeon]
MSSQERSVQKFSGISPAEFFYRNRQMAGFGNPTQAVYSTVRELIENGLDACEDAGKAPEIRIKIVDEDSDNVTVTVKDNGTGLPYDEVAQAFGRILYGSKYERRQKRGTFGLGVTMAILYGQITTDSPVLICTRFGEGLGRAYRLLIDIEKNAPILLSETTKRQHSLGTSVSICFKGDLKRAQERVLEYLRLTTVGTPNARIIFNIDDEIQGCIGPWTSEAPKTSIPVKPHPRAVDVELIQRLLNECESTTIRDFLVTSFQQLGTRTASKLLAFMNIDPKTPLDVLTRQDISRLCQGMRHYDGFCSPDSKCLSPIGEASFTAGVRSTFNTSFLSYGRQGVFEWQGNPVILEGVLAVGDSFSVSDTPTLYRMANRVPLLYDASEDIFTKVVRQTSWRRYGFSKPQPAALFLNVSSTRIPYRATGKQSLAHIMEIERETSLLLKVLGRFLSKKVSSGGAAARNVKKRREYSELIGIVAKYGSELADFDSPPPTEHIVQRLFEVSEDE